MRAVDSIVEIPLPPREKAILLPPGALPLAAV
jgi:hypothetical protein